MGERKVVSKYIPADFDPSLVPRGKKLSSKDGTVPVRMMLPFSLQCSNCNEFLYRGRKFNSKKEPMGGPDGVYLGITRFRFYIKCTHCSRPITFLTDPKNADYEMESGGTRNYEYSRDKKAHDEGAAEEEEKEAKLDPLKALETRVLDSQREMADMENLEAIRAMNARHVKLLSTRKEGEEDNFGADTELVLRARHDKGVTEFDSRELTEEDEALIKSVKFGKHPGKGPSIRRLDENDEALAEKQRQLEAARVAERQRELGERAQHQKKKSIPLIRVKRKRKTEPEAEDSNAAKKEKADGSSSAADQPQGGSLASLLGGYGSESDSD